MNELIMRFNSYPLGQKVLLIFLIMILLGVAFGMGHLQPHYEEVEGIERELTRLQDKQEELDLIKANRAEVLARLESLKRQLLIAREQLPASAEVPSLLQRVHNQAKTAGLEITTFKRLPNSEQPYYTEIPVSMKLVGTYDELANFFYYIGRMTRIVNVKNINLKRQNGGLNSEGELTVTALATTFMYNAQGGGGAKGKGKGKGKGKR